MPKVVISHNVVDVNTWLQGKSERADQIGAVGGSNVRDHVASDGSNAIAVTADLQDVAAFEAAVADPPAELRAAMERHGVLPPLTVYIEK
jgi:hypothetical protein